MPLNDIQLRGIISLVAIYNQMGRHVLAVQHKPTSGSYAWHQSVLTEGV